MIISETRLKHLLSLSKHRHFGLAAASLRISQPALSKSIQGLEVALGVKLLDRERMGVIFTAYGELVLQHGSELLHRQEEMLREMRLLGNLDAGEVTVKFGPYPSVISGYPAAARLMARHPGLRLSLHVGAWSDIGNSVIEERADFGVAEMSQWSPDQRVEVEELERHCAHFFCRPGHPILNSAPGSLAHLSAYPWVGARLPHRIAKLLPSASVAAGHIDPINGEFVPAVEINVPMSLGLFTADSDVLVLAALPMLEADLEMGTVVPVPGFTLESGYSIMHLKKRSPSPATLAYMAEIRAVEAEFVEREKQLAVRYQNLL
jgi:DNA-binding transcriptional LysR family regulator